MPVLVGAGLVMLGSHVGRASGGKTWGSGYWVRVWVVSIASAVVVTLLLGSMERGGPSLTVVRDRVTDLEARLGLVRARS